MSFPRNAALLLAGCCLPATVAAQQPPQRDPQALAVLSQMTAATGWAAVPTDAVGTGAVIVEKPSGPETKNIIIKARPARQFKTEFRDTGTVLEVKGDGGRHSAAGATLHLQPYTTFSMLPLPFLFYTALVEYAEPNTALAYLGVDTLRGQQAHRIEIRPHFHRGDGLDAAREKASRMLLALSATSYVPLELQIEALSTNNPTAALPLTFYFSDYRAVGGVFVPFRMEEFAAGRRRLTLQLTSVQFNVGLPDAEFGPQ